MNILRIVPFFNLPEIGINDNSGFSKTVNELSAEQIKKGHKVLFLSNYRISYKKHKFEIVNPQKYFNFLKAITYALTTIIRYKNLFSTFETKKSHIKILFLLINSYSLGFIIKNKRIAVVHVHSLHDNVIPFILMLFKLKKKFLLTLHFNYSTDKLKYQILFNLLEENQTLITTVSSRTTTQILNAFPKQKISTIVNGYNPKMIWDINKTSNVNIEMSFYNDVKYLLFVGTINYNKNLKFLIDNFHLFNPEIRLLVCGDGPLKEQCVKKVYNRGLSDRIIFFGNVPHNEMPFMYASVDLVCVVSNSEAFGRMFLESAINGTPTLCFNDLSVVENLNHLNGFYTSDRNPYNFTKKAHEILESKTRREDIKNSSTEFSWENINEKYLKVYQKVKLR